MFGSASAPTPAWPPVVGLQSRFLVRVAKGCALELASGSCGWCRGALWSRRGRLLWSWRRSLLRAWGCCHCWGWRQGCLFTRGFGELYGGRFTRFPSYVNKGRLQSFSIGIDVSDSFLEFASHHFACITKIDSMFMPKWSSKRGQPSQRVGVIFDDQNSQAPGPRRQSFCCIVAHSLLR